MCLHGAGVVKEPAAPLRLAAVGCAGAFAQLPTHRLHLEAAELPVLGVFLFLPPSLVHLPAVAVADLRMPLRVDSGEQQLLADDVRYAGRLDELTVGMLWVKKAWGSRHRGRDVLSTREPRLAALGE